MSKKHNDIFDDVLKGLDDGDAPAEAPEEAAGRAQTRFLKRSTAMSE